MFQWYHKNLKQYERLIFGFFLTVIVISFVASGITPGAISEKEKADKDLAVDTPSLKFTRAEFDNLAFRWKHGALGRGNMFLMFLIENNALYAGDFSKNPYAYMMGGEDTREMDREIAVDVCVLLGAAKQADIRVTESEISQRVKDTLSGEGGFDLEKYKEALEKMDVSAEDYEKTVGEYIQVAKYLATLKSGVSVATEDVFNEFVKTGARSKAKYVMFNDMLFRSKARESTSQKSIVEWLNISKNSYGYKKEAQARLEFLKVDYEPLKAGINPTPTDLLEYYNGHKEEFRKPIFTCALPPPEYFFVPQTMLAHDDDDKPVEKEPETAYRTLEEAKADVTEKVKLKKAADMAAETMKAVRAREYEMRVQGTARPDLKVLQKEFSLGDPGTSAWFEEDSYKDLDASLGVPKAGGPGWSAFLDDKPETSRAQEIRTDKGHYFARLAEKQEGQSYLFTGAMRHKAISAVSARDAGLVSRKEMEAVLKDFRERFTNAQSEKMKAGVTLSEADLVTLRFDTFTTLCADRKLEVKETDFLTRSDQKVDGVPDNRPFMQTLFTIETKGDVQTAYGNSGQYLVELLDHRPPKAEDFTIKRTQIQGTLLKEKQGRFMSDTLAQFKKDNCKINADFEKKDVK